MTSPMSYQRRSAAWPARLVLAALLAGACGLGNPAYARTTPALPWDLPRLPRPALLAADEPAGGAAVEEDLPPGLRPEPPPGPELTEAQPAPTVVEDERSVFTTWWFWALAVGIVAGTVALGVAASDDDRPTPARACTTGFICFGDGR